jgi:hypothetical protein
VLDRQEEFWVPFMPRTRFYHKANEKPLLPLSDTDFYLPRWDSYDNIRNLYYFEIPPVVLASTSLPLGRAKRILSLWVVKYCRNGTKCSGSCDRG